MGNARIRGALRRDSSDQRNGVSHWQVSNSSYDAIRKCRECRAECRVHIDIRPGMIAVKCRECAPNMSSKATAGFDPAQRLPMRQIKDLVQRREAGR